MRIQFKQATVSDSPVIADFVCELTSEICLLTKTTHFDLNVGETVKRCQILLEQGHYTAIIGYDEQRPIAVATFTETYALYAQGKIGVIQECYVQPDYRALGIGSELLQQVKKYGEAQQWACIELCTPPLPQFESTLAFYQKNGLMPVGGRKMRETF